MQLSELLSVIRQRWRLIAVCVVLAVAAAVAVTLTTTPVYEARARIYLSAEQTSGRSSGSVFVLTSDDLDTYVSILDTPAVLDPLREELGLAPGHPIQVSAETSGSTSILNITARAANGREAADVANEVGPQLGKVAGEFSTLLKSSGQEVVSTPIQPASAPSRPVSPDPVRNIGLGLLAGLVLGLGLAFVRHALDTKVRGEEDIRAHSDAPMLAGLPAERTSAKGLISVEDDPHGRHAEAVRRLRTNLMFVDVTTGRHSFVVTSAMPGEGKTTTAVNLALAMADSGRRTLLVDADLRNPSVAKTLGMEGSVGLTTVLLGEAPVHDVIQTWGSAGMDVLPAGQVPPNPSELLGSAPMEALLTSLVREYDFVLIDSPPVVPVIDAVVIERLTGGLLMVVGVDRTRKKDLVSALKQLDTVGARVSGFARNFVVGKSGGEYRYGYHSYEEQVTKDKRSARREQAKVRAKARQRSGSRS